MNAFENVIAALRAHGCKSAPGGMWRCPSHQDKTPSLHISQRDGRVLLKCFGADCTAEAIVAALGLRLSDLFDGEPSPASSSREALGKAAVPPPPPFTTSERDVERDAAQLGDRVAERLRELRGWEPAVLRRLGVGRDGERITFPIRDAEGRLVGLKRFLPNPGTRGTSPKVLAAPGSTWSLFPRPEDWPGAKVLCVGEGEADALCLASLGFPAVGVPSASWRASPDDVRRLTEGRTGFILLADADEPGRRLMAELAAASAAAGVPVKVLDLWPGRSDGSDLSDWVRERRTAGEEWPRGVARHLSELTKAAPLWRPPRQKPDPGVDERDDGADRLDGPRGERVADVGGEDGAALLDEVAGFLRHFVVMDEHQADACALWTMHTHSAGAAEATPYLAVTSAEKRSGKTRCMEVLALLVPRPLLTANISTAALFRTIADEAPTVFVDEADAIFARGRGPDTEDLRSLLNSGHRRGAEVVRMVGQGAAMTARRFPVFGPKCIAAIGSLPDTIEDRSIPIRLRRAAPGERVERFRRREAEPEGAALRARLAAWAGARLEPLRDARPELPQQLDDRAADGWEPLLALADAAGGEWPERARAAAAALSEGRSDEDNVSLGIRLLHDIRLVFEEAGADRLATASLVAALVLLDEAPWGDLRGRPLDGRRLGRMLRDYGVRSRSVRAGDSTARGFARESFEDPWLRYLPPSPPQERTHRTQRTHPSVHAGLEVPAQTTRNAHIAHNAHAENPVPMRVVCDVRDVCATGGVGSGGRPHEEDRPPESTNHASPVGGVVEGLRSVFDATPEPLPAAEEVVAYKVLHSEPGFEVGIEAVQKRPRTSAPDHEPQEEPAGRLNGNLAHEPLFDRRSETLPGMGGLA